ncbi:N-acetylmuramoyl-L-alanine amidase, partial [Streptomyces sp. NPDC127574]
MSYVGPDFDPPQPRRFRRGPLTVAAAALVPGALAGWLVWMAVGDDSGGGSDRAAPATSSSAPGSGAPSAAGSASATARDDGKPGKSPKP